MFFKKFKKKHYNSFFYNTQLVTKRPLTVKNILAQKTPISERVLSQYNLEFFYKLNKALKFDLSDISIKNNLIEQENSEVFTLYLRNFHQKPY